MTLTQLNLPGQGGFQPVLQAQDGSYVGTVSSSIGNLMAAVTTSGTLKWTVPGSYNPVMAMIDGGALAKSGDGLSTLTFDQNGNATGQKTNLAPPNQGGQGQWPGWFGNSQGNAYSVASGTATLVASATTTYATTFAAVTGGNQSGSLTAIQQVQTNQVQSYQKQIPKLYFPVYCFPLLTPSPLLALTPTCGNINAIELLTDKTPNYIFQNYMTTFDPVVDAPNRNTVMLFEDATNPVAPINVTTSGQVLQISLKGFNSALQKPFFVMTERVDSVNHVISVVTLKGHPLAGWRYWRVYSIGVNDVVIETGAYDEPAPGLANYAGYYIAIRRYFSRLEGVPVVHPV